MLSVTLKYSIVCLYYGGRILHVTITINRFYSNKMHQKENNFFLSELPFNCFLCNPVGIIFIH